MIRARLIKQGLLVSLALVCVCVVVWILAGLDLYRNPATANADSRTTRGETPVIRLALIPERDIFDQRRRYSQLVAYLQDRLGCIVELVTVSSYAGVLDELQSGSVDGAFLGSMVTVLAHDRLGVRILVKPECPNGDSCYHGVVFVPEDSTIRGIEDLQGQSLALVRMTTAGQLFAMHLLKAHDLLAADRRPKLRWAGTHDEVILDVAEGLAAAGAVKNTRLDAYQREHPQARFRRLVESPDVPSNALVMRREFDPQLTRRLSQALMTMDENPAGLTTLEAFGAVRFTPCVIGEYQAIYNMVESLGPTWLELDAHGPAPRRLEPKTGN